MSEVDYWNSFYATKGATDVPVDASTFAQFTCDWLTQSNAVSTVLVDLGCGTGRDSRFFAARGCQVIGIDQVSEEVRSNPYLENGGRYVVGDLGNLDASHIFQGDAAHENDGYGTVDVLYSRFVIHSIDRANAARLYAWAKRALRPGGLFFIEARSIADPLYLTGVRSDPHDTTVSIHGHYRRFIVLEELLRELREDFGFEILYHTESNNLSIHGDDNPVLVRVVCRK